MILSSLDKHLNILDILAEHPKGLTLSAISALTNQPVSSLHHALSTFKLHGYVFQNPETKKYVLGLKFLSISRAILANIDIRKIAHAELEKLQEVTQEMVLLSVLRQGQVVYLDKINTVNKLCQDIEIGNTAEAFTCTSGKSLLSALSDKELEELYPYEILSYKKNNKELDKIDPIMENMVNSRSKLFEEIKEIRRLGYFFGEELYYYGVRAVSTPIISDGKLIACICVTGSSFTMTTEKIYDVIIPQILLCRKTLSEKISLYV